MNRIIIAAILSLSATCTHAADISADAGRCAAYKAVLKDMAAGQQALNTARNKALAQNHFLDFLKRAKAAGTSKSALLPLVNEGQAACATVGVR